MIKYIYVFLTIAIMTSHPVYAQELSQQAIYHAGMIAKNCAPIWDNPNCIRSVGDSNYEFLSIYGAQLQYMKKDVFAENLKNSCAASTASRTDPVPAYALRSAMIECANAVSDISGKSGITPDLSHYQLMVAGTICLAGAPECQSIMEQLKSYAR